MYSLYIPDWPSLKMAIHELSRSPASVFTSVVESIDNNSCKQLDTHAGTNNTDIMLNGYMSRL